MTDLLPCPFCGGRAERIDIEDGDNAGGSCVICAACNASGNVEFGFKENFVSNWNRLARLAGERDEVRALIEDLLSWFPEKPAPSEWRIRAGELGADGAISAARKFIGGNDA